MIYSFEIFALMSEWPGTVILWLSCKKNCGIKSPCSGKKSGFWWRSHLKFNQLIKVFRATQKFFNRNWSIWQYELWSFQTGYIKLDFCLRINIPKGNFWILKIGLTGSLSSLQISESLKLITLIFHVKKLKN